MGGTFGITSEQQNEDGSSTEVNQQPDNEGGATKEELQFGIDSNILDLLYPKNEGFGGVGPPGKFNGPYFDNLPPGSKPGPGVGSGNSGYGTGDGYTRIGDFIGDSYPAAPSNEIDVNVDSLGYYLREVFEILKNRGVNPLQADIIAETEFIPFVNNESEIAYESANNNLNFGNNIAGSTSSVATLVEIHKGLRNLMQELTNQFFFDSTGLTNPQQRLLVYLTERFLDNWFEKVFDSAFGSNDGFINFFTSNFQSTIPTIDVLIVNRLSETILDSVVYENYFLGYASALFGNFNFNIEVFDPSNLIELQGEDSENPEVTILELLDSVYSNENKRQFFFKLYRFCIIKKINQGIIEVIKSIGELQNLLYQTLKLTDLIPDGVSEQSNETDFLESGNSKEIDVKKIIKSNSVALLTNDLEDENTPLGSTRSILGTYGLGGLGEESVSSSTFASNSHVFANIMSNIYSFALCLRNGAYNTSSQAKTTFSGNSIKISEDAVSGNSSKGVFKAILKLKELYLGGGTGIRNINLRGNSSFLLSQYPRADYLEIDLFLPNPSIAGYSLGSAEDSTYLRVTQSRNEVSYADESLAEIPSDSIQNSSANGSVSYYEPESNSSNLTAANLESIISSVGTGDKEKDIAEIVAALIWDQTVEANIRNSGKTISTPAGLTNSNSSTTGTINKLEDFGFNFSAIKLVNAIVLPVEKDNNNFQTISSQNNALSLLTKELITLDNFFDNKLTEVSNALFGLKDINETGESYSPLTIGYGDKNYRENIEETYLTGLNTLILKGIQTGDLDFKLFGNFIDSYEASLNNLSTDLIEKFGLDFGGFYSNDVNGISNQIQEALTPMKYFKFMCNALAEDVDNFHPYSFWLLETGKKYEDLILGFGSQFFGFLASNECASQFFENHIRIEVNGNSNLDDNSKNVLQFINKMSATFTDQLIYKRMERDFNIISPYRRSEKIATFTKNDGDAVNLYAQKLLNRNDGFLGLAINAAYNNSSSETNNNVLFGSNNALRNSGTWSEKGNDATFFEWLCDGLNMNPQDVDIDNFSTFPTGFRIGYDQKFFEAIIKNSMLIDNKFPNGITDNLSTVEKNNIDFYQSSNNWHFSPNKLDSKIGLNVDAGQFGGIFSTNTFQRALMFYVWSLFLLEDSISVNVEIRDLDSGNFSFPKWWVKTFPDQRNGVAAALNGVFTLNEDTNSQEKTTSYSLAKAHVNNVSNALMNRKTRILSGISYLYAQVRTLKRMRSYAQGLFSINNSLYSNPIRAIGLSMLSGAGYFDKYGSLITPASVSNITRAIDKNFTLTPLGSKFPAMLPEAETFNVSEIKNMFKVLTRKGYGLTADEKLGRKKIFHIGIPAGLIESLRSLAYAKSNDERYLQSGMIVIQILKSDDLNPDVRYLPRNYVFNVSKTVGFKNSSNQIKNFSDSWTGDDVVGNVSIFTSTLSGTSFSGVGFDGIKTNPDNQVVSNVYEDNVYQSMLENHVADHYLKMYTKLTTGLDINEETLKIFQEDTLTNQLQTSDGSNNILSSNDLFLELQRKILLLHPAVNVDPTIRPQFFRTLEICKSSHFFSSLNRFKSSTAVNMFDRIFSIVVNERDFLFNQGLISYDSETNESQTINIFEKPNSELITFDYSTQVGVSQFQPVDVEDVQNYPLGSKNLNDYLISLEDNSTHVSKYSIKIGILKDNYNQVNI